MDQSTRTEDQQLPPRLDLLDLPDEVLERMLKEAHDPQRPIGYLCRDLLHIQRRVLFEVVEVYSHDKLAKLVHFLLQQPNFGLYTVMLSLHFPPHPPMTPSPTFPSNSSLLHFFSRLPRLRHLRVKGTTRICRLLLSPTMANARMLPRLTTLEMHAAWFSWTDLHSPEHWDALLSFANLRSVTIWTESFVSVCNPEAPDLSLARPFLHIRELKLGQLLSQTQTASFLSLFPHLDSLFLADYRSPVHLPRSLTGLSCPSLLLRLFLHGGRPPAAEQDLIWSIEPQLPFFSSLQDLHLRGRHDCTPSFFRALLHLPLRCLMLERDVIVSGASLVNFVYGVDRHSSIERLTLSTVFAIRGTSIRQQAPPVDDDGRYTIHPDWDLGEWPDGCTAHDVQLLIDAAKKSDIVVKGSTIEALEVSVDHERERDLLKEWIKVEEEKKEKKRLEEATANAQRWRPLADSPQLALEPLKRA